jgi:hypothetical protein
MATGIKKLRKVQFGPEETPGSPVAATIKWRGPGVGVEPLDVIEFVEEDIGRFGDANRTVKLSAGAQLSIPDTLLTFEQFGLLCQMAIESQQTGVQDGTTGSGYIYTFDFPLTSANTIKTWTVEAGNNEECADMEYVFCMEFGVRGTQDEGVMLSGSLRGRQYTAGQSFASLSAPSVDSAVFNLSKLYIDAVGGTMGNTQQEGVFLGFNISVKTGLQPVVSGDGNLYFYTHEQVGWEISVDVVFKHTGGGAAETEHANWLAQTARLLEIKLEGAGITQGDGDYAKKTVRFQLPGKWQKFAALEDRNGVDILTGTFVSKYDPTASLGPKILVVHEDTSYWS